MTLQAHTVQEAWSRQPVDFPALLGAERFDEVDRSLRSRHAAIRDEESEKPFNAAMRSFDAFIAASTGTRRVLDLLETWARALPDSPMPWLLRARYWSQLAYEVRGSGWASTVGEAQWAVTAVLRDATLLVALKALARDPSCYQACACIIRVVGGFGEPEWLDRWLTQGQVPDAAAFAPEPGLRQHLAQAHGLHPADEFAPPAAALPEVLLRLRSRRAELAAEDDFKRFWVEAALACHPWAGGAVDTYMLFATERWGGSDEALTAFVDSPWCARFNEADKNARRFGYQFFDKVMGDSSDPDNRRHDLSVCHKALRRPLPDWALAHVNLRLARIHAAEADTREAGDPDRDALLRQAEGEIAAAARQVSDMHDLVFVIDFWLRHARDKTWIGAIASEEKLHHPYAAMLYGWLLEQGWGGLPKRPDLSAQWYDLAATGMPPPLEADGDDPYKVLYIPLCEMGDSISPLRLIEHGAERGYPSAQFRLGYIHDERCKAGDAGAASPMLKNYRAAAESGFWPALYNLMVYHIRLSNAEGASTQTIEEHRGKAVQHAVRLLDLYDQAEEVHPVYQDYPDRLLSYFKELLDWSCERHSSVTRLMLPQLRSKAQAGWLDAMCGMALLHGDKRDKQHHQYREAVRWVWGAKKIDAEHASVLETEAAIEGESVWRRFKYLVTAGRIPAHELPGQGGQTAL